MKPFLSSPRSLSVLLLAASLFASLSGCANDVADADKVGDADADAYDVGAADSAGRPTYQGALVAAVSAEGSFGRDARYLSWTFDAAEGDEITLTTDALRPASLDTVASIYRASASLDPTGRALASNDDCDASTLDSCITWTAPEAGTFVVVVRRYDRGTSGRFAVRYDVAAREQACGSRGLGPCPEGQFCSWAPEAMCGRADHPGVCTTRPDACITLYDPVCGCDGETYSNACNAASAGVSVASSGECATTGSCDAQDAVGMGMCRRLPFGFAWSGRACVVVQGCTCEGEDCDALYATSEDCVAAHSECEVSCGGIAGFTCAEGQYCSYAPETMCGAGDQMGTCLEIPTVCTREVRPVCGCDGSTYSNACNAAAAGVSVASEGACAPAAPECRAVGTRSEGWYNPDGSLICWTRCGGATASCGAVGSRSEGWYASADGAGCGGSSRLVHWADCSP